MAFDRQKPFNDLPLLPPAAELKSKAVLKQVIGARTALAELMGVPICCPFEVPPPDHHVKNLCRWGLSCKEFAISFT